MRNRMYIEKPSTPFSNGTEYELFVEYFCENCKAYKLREADGFPEFPEFGGCPILDKMERAYFDSSFFPENDIVEIRDAETNKIISWHSCKKFEPRTEKQNEI